MIRVFDQIYIHLDYITGQKSFLTVSHQKSAVGKKVFDNKLNVQNVSCFILFIYLHIFKIEIEMQVIDLPRQFRQITFF